MINSEKYFCKEEKEVEGSLVTFIWHPEKILENVPIHHVSGFAISQDGLVALVRDEGETRFTLPGGSREEGESAEESLLREFQEEAQFTPTRIRLLGTLEVVNELAKEEIQKHHQQVLFMCEISDLEKFVPSKDGFEVAERIFVYAEDVPLYVQHMSKSVTGKAQFDMFMENIKQE